VFLRAIALSKKAAQKNLQKNSNGHQ